MNGDLQKEYKKLLIIGELYHVYYSGATLVYLNALKALSESVIFNTLREYVVITIRGF